MRKIVSSQVGKSEFESQGNCLNHTGDYFVAQIRMLSSGTTTYKYSCKININGSAECAYAK
jgi:hypothetical protein